VTLQIVFSYWKRSHSDQSLLGNLLDQFMNEFACSMHKSALKNASLFLQKYVAAQLFSILMIVMFFLHIRMIS